MKLKIILTVFGILALLAIISYVIVIALDNEDVGKEANNDGNKKTSAAKQFSHAAVASDAKQCSQIGKDVLLKNGTAVDAAVASLFCIGLYNMHSSGVGGGGFMNIYLREEKKSIIYDFREKAPAAANKTMFLNASSIRGGLAIGVPGNVKGLRHVWEKHGKIPWRSLVQPSIELAKNGYPLSKAAANYMSRMKNVLGASAGFRQLLKKSDDTWFKTGEIIKNPSLAATLEIIRDKPDDFYTGELAVKIAEDIKNAGGIITVDDLRNYEVAEREALLSSFKNMTFRYMPPPGGGAVVAMALNILKGYTFKTTRTNVEEVQVMHRFIEALKFAFARRPLLGDPSFENDVTNVTDAMLNQTFGEELCRRIKDDGVYANQTHYGGYYSQDQSPYGTSHISIISENGDAVAATDTINYPFGSLVRSNTTGIIYNNEMDDFSTPGKVNTWGYAPTPANFIKPGKRPLSSMSPTIVTNHHGHVVMVAGSSGGSRIISATALTIYRKLFLGMELGESITKHRVHTHLLPDLVYVNREYPISQYMQDELKKLGHKLEMSDYWAAVQAVFSDGNTLYAKSDPRKGGQSNGY